MVAAAPMLQRYPKHVTLEDGVKVTIRPLEKKDKVPLAEFFHKIPEDDKYYLKENVSAPEVIQDWVEELDYERVIPIIALVDGKIVADATLHRSRAQARRHVGELRVVVDTAYRGRGVGSRLIQELIDLAHALELDKVFFELVDRREMDAIHAAAQSGFEEVAVLRNRVKDMYGSLQDLVIMELPIQDEMAFGHF